MRLSAVWAGMHSKTSNNSLVVVAAHTKRTAPQLSSPYREIFRGEDHVENGFDHGVAYLPYTSIRLETWSEYSALLAVVEEFPNYEVIGLMHYRCVLDLNVMHGQASILPWKTRNSFLKSQVDQIYDLGRSSLIVSIPHEFETSAWNQFHSALPAHRNLGALFEETCLYFDSICDFELGTARYFLESNFNLISRNLFVGPRQLIEDWISKVILLINFLEVRAPSEADSRWGAYIIERLFSVYVWALKEKLPGFVEYRPMTYFE